MSFLFNFDWWSIGLDFLLDRDFILMLMIFNIGLLLRRLMFILVIQLWSSSLFKSNEVRALFLIKSQDISEERTKLFAISANDFVDSLVDGFLVYGECFEVVAVFGIL